MVLGFGFKDVIQGLGKWGVKSRQVLVHCKTPT